MLEAAKMAVPESIQEKSYRLLEAIKAHTEHTLAPVFVEALAPELGMSVGEVQGAFRYLKGKHWMDTFDIDYTARINAAGHDVVAQRSSALSVSSLPQSATTLAPVRRDSPMKWDVFISHASEDKAAFVGPLATRLQERGLRVWYDAFTPTVGDSLRRSIDRGLARSRYGIVVISPDFLKKEWPQKELDGLVAREVEGVKVILPIWHNINEPEVRAYSPTLADKLGVSSSKGLDDVTDQLLKAIGHSSGHTFTPPATAQTSPPKPEANATNLQQLADYASDLHRHAIAHVLAGAGRAG